MKQKRGDPDVLEKLAGHVLRIVIRRIGKPVERRNNTVIKLTNGFRGFQCGPLFVVNFKRSSCPVRLDPVQ